MAIHAEERSLGTRGPAPLEAVLVFLVTTVLSDLTAIWTRTLLQGTSYLALVSWASHLTQLIIAWGWYRVRVAPFLPPDRRSLLRWRSAGTRLFFVMAAWILVLKFVPSVIEAVVSPSPSWMRGGAVPIALMLLFQGVWVGLTEELAMRPAFHLPLSLRLTGKVRVWRWELSHALLWTALAFGLIHLPNVFLGQSLADTAVQALLSSVIGLFFGYYYERTDNYVGAALLHNLLDVCGFVAVLIVGLL